MFLSPDHNVWENNVMSTLTTSLDDSTLDFANARLVALASGLRPERRAALAWGLLKNIGRFRTNFVCSCCLRNELCVTKADKTMRILVSAAYHLKIEYSNFSNSKPFEAFESIILASSINSFKAKQSSTMKWNHDYVNERTAQIFSILSFRWRSC